MLKLLRKKETFKKIIFWVIIGVMALAFVFWGIGSYKQESGGPGYAGIIWGKKVSVSKFRKIRLSCLTDIRERFQDKYSEILPYINVHNQAWLKLILLEHTKKLKITISDQEVIQTIASNPLFFKDGKFNKGVYDRILRYFFNIPAREYEEQIRDNLIIKKLYEQAAKDVTVSDEELVAAYKKDFESVSITYIQVQHSDFINQVEIQDEELKDYYNKNSSKYKFPPTVKVEYLKINYPEDSKENQKIKILNDIKNLYPKIKNTKDLKSIEKEAARLNLGKINYQQTGFFSIDELIEGVQSIEFQKIAFGLKEGQTSPIIQGPEELYILRLIQKKDSYIPALEETKEKAAKDLKLIKAKEKAKEKIDEYKKKIDEQLKKEPNLTLKEVSKILSVEVKTSPAFKQEEYVPEISKETQKAAFSLTHKEISGILETDSSYFIIQQDKFEAINEEKFKQEKETYRKNLEGTKKEETFNNLVKELFLKANLKDYTSYINFSE